MGDTDFPSLSLSPNQTFIAADADRGCASMMRSGRDLGDCWAEKRTDNKECPKDGALCNDRWRRCGRLLVVGPTG